ncbi:phosphopantetheine-binding protein [Halorubrum halodurans]|uniref:Acyl carrier protein n=1 Tax=Halorubrum halodurans TaxID=1383851 RepID=A0A256II35_9EURY|nr:phosphopantetheine-binding protein [Halorubrum halodurans]OYR55797.1 acyl carrier protein [Halorubrum halodurans]
MSNEAVAERETLRNILNEILESKDDASTVSAINDDMSLTDDLGLDSLDLAEMTVRIEDEYRVDVFEDEVVDEVGEVLSKINS